MTGLKPCPFCGGEAYIAHRKDEMFHHWNYYCGCVDCGVETLGHYRKKEAIKAWNHRPSLWRTGAPTEEGCFYALQCKGYTHPEPYFGVVVNGAFSAMNGNGDLMPLPPDLIAWQKITPFVESAQEKETDNE